MRKLMATLLLALSIGGSLSGCGSQKEDTVLNPFTSEVISEVISQDILEETSEDIAENISEGISEDTSDVMQETEEDLFGEIYGEVESFTEDGFVINQTIVSEDTMTMATDNENKILLTVHCTDKTVYALKEIRNSGVNGEADLTTKDAVYKDIIKGSFIALSGTWDGNEYHAAKISIIKNI